MKKVMQWEEEDQVNEKRSQMGRRWTEDPMDVDDAEDDYFERE